MGSFIFKSILEEKETRSNFYKQLIFLFKKISGISGVEKHYLNGLKIKKQNEHLGEAILRSAGINFAIHGDLSKIPATGPLLTISNHPYGMAEGVALLSILFKIRQDYKLVANKFLTIFPILTESMILVDVYKNKTSINENKKPLRKMLKLLQENKSIGFFPSGEVSHWTWSQFKVRDPKWSDAPAMLALKSQATIIPITFHGSNPIFFQIAGLLHPMLRTALIGQMFLKQKKRTMHITIGDPIPVQNINTLNKTSDITSYLRKITEDNINNTYE